RGVGILASLGVAIRAAERAVYGVLELLAIHVDAVRLAATVRRGTRIGVAAQAIERRRFRFLRRCRPAEREHHRRNDCYLPRIAGDVRHPSAWRARCPL